MNAQSSSDGHAAIGDSLSVIRLFATQLDQIERTRIQASNRLKAFERQHGSPPPTGATIVQALAAIEHEIVLQLQRAWRTHPLAPWAKPITGAGEKLMARLIADIGDPAIAQPMAGARTPEGDWIVVPNGPPHDRTLRQLWQYCGLGDPTIKRRRGATEDEQRAAGKTSAKKTLWLLTDQFVRHRTTPYRELYDAEKARYLGEGIPPIHAENRARRRVSKEFLRHLWEAARDVHIRCESHEEHGADGGFPADTTEEEEAA